MQSQLAWEGSRFAEGQGKGSRGTANGNGRTAERLSSPKGSPTGLLSSQPVGDQGGRATSSYGRFAEGRGRGVRDEEVTTLYNNGNGVEIPIK